MTDDIPQRMVEFLPRLRRFAYVLTGDVDKDDDLVQETCARALSRLDQLEPGTRLDSWMFRIAQTRWFDRLRSVAKILIWRLLPILWEKMGTNNGAPPHIE